MALKIFVYGSLKRGYWNNARCLSEQRFIKDAETEPNYRLFDNGHYPCMIETENTEHKGVEVKGEIWEVDKKCLSFLDAMEAGAGYKRVPVKLKNFVDEVHTYVYQEDVSRFRDCADLWENFAIKQT